MTSDQWAHDEQVLQRKQTNMTDRTLTEMMNEYVGSPEEAAALAKLDAMRAEKEAARGPFPHLPWRVDGDSGSVQILDRGGVSVAWADCGDDVWFDYETARLIVDAVNGTAK